MSEQANTILKTIIWPKVVKSFKVFNGFGVLDFIDADGVDLD
jgi:hypothetical protein